MKRRYPARSSAARGLTSTGADHWRPRQGDKLCGAAPATIGGKSAAGLPCATRTVAEPALLEAQKRILTDDDTRCSVRLSPTQRLADSEADLLSGLAVRDRRAKGLQIVRADLSTGVDCGHGTCSATNGAAACTCDSGYEASGQKCVAEANPCAGVDCGHGTCSATNGAAACTCDSGYEASGLECKAVAAFAGFLHYNN